MNLLLWICPHTWPSKVCWITSVLYELALKTLSHNKMFRILVLWLWRAGYWVLGRGLCIIFLCQAEEGWKLFRLYFLDFLHRQPPLETPDLRTDSGSQCEFCHCHVISVGKLEWGDLVWNWKSVELVIVQQSERPCYHCCHCYCRWHHQHRHKPPRERQKPVSGCRGLCLFASFSVGGETRCGEIDWGRTCPSPAHTLTHTRAAGSASCKSVSPHSSGERGNGRDGKEKINWAKRVCCRLWSPPLLSPSPSSPPLLPFPSPLQLRHLFLLHKYL